MKYNMEETLEEVRRREKKIARCHEKRRIRSISATALLLLGSLVTMMSFLGQSGGGAGDAGAYGAIFLYADVGLYVLVAAIAFMLGVAGTLICLELKHMYNETQSDKKSENDDEE